MVKLYDRKILSNREQSGQVPTILAIAPFFLPMFKLLKILVEKIERDKKLELNNELLQIQLYSKL